MNRTKTIILTGILPATYLIGKKVGKRKATKQIRNAK